MRRLFSMDAKDGRPRIFEASGFKTPLPARRWASNFGISEIIAQEQATETVIIREYASTTQLAIGSWICFGSTNEYSGIRLCKRWNASFSKRDYGQRDGDYGRHYFGVDIHIALLSLAP
jgi:hypothetical protein